jgi:hypothetical protein
MVRNSTFALMAAGLAFVLASPASAMPLIYPADEQSTALLVGYYGYGYGNSYGYHYRPRYRHYYGHRYYPRHSYGYYGHRYYRPYRRHYYGGY